MAHPPFPHMFPNDVPLFAAFVLSPEGEGFTRWEFDVRVGVGIDPGPAFDPNLRAGALALTMLRIDAVGWIGATPTIFEVKPDARLSAFGQVLAYCYYFQEERGVTCRRGVITDSVTPNVVKLYRAFDIEIHLVQPATMYEIALARRKVYANGH